MGQKEKRLTAVVTKQDWIRTEPALLSVAWLGVQHAEWYTELKRTKALGYHVACDLT